MEFAQKGSTGLHTGRFKPEPEKYFLAPAIFQRGAHGIHSVLNSLPRLTACDGQGEDRGQQGLREVWLRR